MTSQSSPAMLPYGRQPWRPDYRQTCKANRTGYWFRMRITGAMPLKTFAVA